MANNDSRVLIAGGGPVGLLGAWLLGRQGIPVRLFDSNEGLQADPRAATTHPATLDLLVDDGLSQDMAQVGLVAPIFQFWDRPSDRLVAEFDHAVLAKDTQHPFVVQCEQFKTSKLLLKRVQALPNVEVLFGHEVVDVRQAGAGASVDVDVKGPSGVQTHGGAYLIGADGGRSVVRKRSEIDFDGFTWPERFIVLTTPFDFNSQRGYSYRSYFAEPGAWCNCFKVSADGPPGLWRTVFPTEPSQEDSWILSDAGVQERMQKFFPSARPYEVVHRNLYVTHQRVASTFRKGRVLLAGDAAHVNNPIGGMGMNSGFQDALNIADKLVSIWQGADADALLDRYDRQRRLTAIEYVQAQSIANKRTLEERDTEKRRQNLDNLRRMADDPKQHLDFVRRSSLIAMLRSAEAIE
jgi:3-(3-hydroxy-phenyl)propionate hydroxylase